MRGIAAAAGRGGQAQVACFIKQIGAEPVGLGCLMGTKRKHRDRKGGDLAEWPADLQVREFPEVRP